VQLSYEVPESVTRMLKMKHLSFHVDASNLITFSKYVNIRDMSIGAEPYYRSFSIGIKSMF
jgi:hypothetical protein